MDKINEVGVLSVISKMKCKKAVGSDGLTIVLGDHFHVSCWEK